jgi:hypothetical protein
MSGPDGLEERTAFYDEAFRGSEDMDDRDCDDWSDDSMEAQR